MTNKKEITMLWDIGQHRMVKIMTSPGGNMKTIISTLTALTLALLLVIPVLAQDMQQESTVTKTFQLTINGAIPEGESFGVEATVRGSFEPTVLYFCGPESELFCLGNGTVYTQTATFPLGSELRFTFFRGFTESPNFELISEGTEILNSDMTNSATYPAGSPERLTLSFAVTVTGTPCPDATYWAVLGVPGSEFFTVQLADPDGDGIYTGSTTWGPNPLFVSLVQGIGAVQPQVGVHLFPGPPTTTIRDFGQVTPTQDMVFEGSIAGCPAGAPVSGTPAEQPVQLPDTGASAALPAALVAGGLLLVGGVYLRRRMWQQA
jgi:LPXTG-motif cell wall-anchored protein